MGWRIFYEMVTIGNIAWYISTDMQRLESLCTSGSNASNLPGNSSPNHGNYSSVQISNIYKTWMLGIFMINLMIIPNNTNNIFANVALRW